MEKFKLLILKIAARVRGQLSMSLLARALYVLALSASLSALSISAAVHFGWMRPVSMVPTVKPENTDAADDADDEEIANTDAAPAADAQASDDDDDDTSMIADEDSYEIPEALRPEVTPDPFVVSVLGPLGLLKTLAPESTLDQPLVFDRERILDDEDQRIADEFHIPAALRQRVGFWFDVYSKYDSNHRIIHHSLYPWIVYKVVDVSLIIDSDTPSHLWMRREKADRVVRQEVLKIRATLKRLASRRDFTHLTEAEQEVADALAPLNGSLRKQALIALRSVRVQTGQKDFFNDGLKLSARYLPTMEKIFISHKVPVELTRIPFVESSFNRQATSKVGACGIWQFMGNTGRKYMMVDGAIDERRSPFKATEAAARLLKENHLILRHSWPLAVTAWNHGPTGLRKAMSRAGSNDLATIISRYRSRSFDFASSNFYSEFLGALHAERYSDEIFGKIDRPENVELQVVKLARAVRFNDVLKVSGLTMDEFLAINPELVTAAKKNLMLPRGFRLHIPESALESLEHLLASYDHKGSPAI